MTLAFFHLVMLVLNKRAELLVSWSSGHNGEKSRITLSEMNKNPVKLIMSEVGCRIQPILPGHPTSGSSTEFEIFFKNSSTIETVFYVCVFVCPVSIVLEFLKNISNSVELPEVGCPGSIGWIRHPNIINFTGFLFR